MFHIRYNIHVSLGPYYDYDFYLIFAYHLRRYEVMKISGRTRILISAGIHKWYYITWANDKNEIDDEKIPFTLIL